MKRILLILLLLPMFTQAQTGVKWDRYFFTGSMKLGGGLQGYANATQAAQDSNSYAEPCAFLEIGNDTSTRGILIPRVLVVSGIASPKKGLMAYEISTGYFKGYNGSVWQRLDSAGGGGIVDSSIFATQYWVGQNYQPIGTYITPSDTGFMLANYLLSSVAAATYQPIGSYLTSETDPISPHLSDSTVDYVTPTQLAALNYLTSYTETDPLSLHLTDTAAMLANYATDAAVALKLNISDTAAMLSPYLRKIDTTNKWLPIGTTFVGSEVDPLSLHISDTATAFNPYLRKIDTTGKWLSAATVFDPSITNELQTFNQTLALDSIGLHQMGISNPNSSIAAHFQGNNTSYRMAINTSSNGAGLQGYNNALSSVRMITIQGSGGNTRIGGGTDNGTGIQLARQVRIDSLSTGTGSDSLVVVSGGILKRVAQVAATTPDWQTVMTAGNSFLGSAILQTASGQNEIVPSATSNLLDTIPNWSGKFLVAAGTGSSGQVIQSNGSSQPTWVTPSSGGLWTTSSVTGTTNAGSTNFGSITPTSGQMVVIQVTYSAIAGADGGGGIAYGLFYNNAGTISTFNSTDVVFFNGTGALAGAVTSFFNITGTTISYNIDTTPPAGTVNWKVEFEYKIY